VVSAPLAGRWAMVGGLRMFARTGGVSPRRTAPTVVLVEALVPAGPTMDPAARTPWAQIGRWLRDWRLERPSLGLAHLRDYALASPRPALGTFRHALADRIEEKLPRVQARSLVVRGELDPIVPQRWAEEVVRLVRAFLDDATA
jgi:hypothetical protein